MLVPFPKCAHTLSRSCRRQLRNLSLRWVLTQSTQQIAEILAGNRARALLVKERKSLLNLGVRLYVSHLFPSMRAP